MTENRSELSGLAFVLRGSFDLSALQPSKMLKAQLIRETDLTDLAISIYAPEIVSFRFAWMEVIAEKDKLQASTIPANPLPEPVRDFLLELIPEMNAARITGVGVNSLRHVQAKEIDAWHRIGHKLVQKDAFWNTVLSTPGTQRVDVRGERTDGFRGHVTIRVEPSIRMQNGVYVDINDHFEALEDEVSANPTGLLDRLSDSWTAILGRAESIIEKIKQLEGS